MIKRSSVIAFCCLSILQLLPCRGEGLSPEVQKKVDAIVATIQGWASDPVIVKAVKAQNAHLPEAIGSISAEKWDQLTVLDPVVRSMVKNEVGLFLKSKMTDAFSLALVNDAEGYKVAYVTKPKNWLHKGLPQHDQPMLGKIYQGPVVTHPATGMLQLLLGIPVLENEKPIGTVIVGVKASAL